MKDEETGAGLGCLGKCAWSTAIKEAGGGGEAREAVWVGPHVVL